MSPAPPSLPLPLHVRSRSPSLLLRRRPSQIYTVLRPDDKKFLLPVQVEDRSRQLGMPSPLMKHGRKTVKKVAGEDGEVRKRLWEEKPTAGASGAEKTE